uniref:C2H2-type domain-containing protein n=1 Tax=Ditylenchus dipsaci TaxID=166011 RepID=A0A915ELU6_9BILA
MEVYGANEAIAHQIPSKIRRLAEDQAENIFTKVDGYQKTMESTLTNQVESNVENNEEDIDDEMEYVEENAYGQIMQGEDGQFYVVMDKNTSPDIELDKLNNVQVITNSDGTETLILEDTSKKIVASKANSVDPSDMPAYNIASTDRTNQATSEHASALRAKDTNEMDGENDEFNVVEQVAGEEGDDSKYPRGLKQRRSRVYGACRCPECGQSFVNTARLERHLAVHQVFGSYLCPLCGKTYKYEYNLFYHWRKTCRDMNDLLDSNTRKNLEVNNLRKMVEEIARKKVEIGPLEIGISGQQLYRNSNTFDRGNSNSSMARKSATCKECGVVTLEAHMSRHLAIHRGELSVDEKSIGGGYFCELCGLMFREHPNLIKHWRTGCQEIQANLPEYCDFALDDSALKEMVRDLLKKACIGTSSSGLKSSELSNQSSSKEHELVENIPRERHDNLDDTNSEGKKLRDVPIRSLHPSEINTIADADLIDVVNNQQNEIDERWADDNGIMFADDYMDDEEEVASHMFLMGDEGHLLSDRVLTHHVASVEQDRLNLNHNQTVQCNECFRASRHLAGAHCSIGTHHCILCGNRFKYDYNLLYHYRRSCGYTKMWIEPEVREQLDAVELKKLVRHLANKEVRVSNGNGTVYTSHSNAIMSGNIMGHRQELHQHHQPHSSSSFMQLPHSLQLASRPGLPEARQCPICSIAFYGSSVLNRHMKVAHPHEYELWEPSAFDGLEGASSPSGGQSGHLQDQIDQSEQQHSVEAQLEDNETQSMPDNTTLSHHLLYNQRVQSLKWTKSQIKQPITPGWQQSGGDWMEQHPDDEEMHQQAMPSSARRVIQTRQRTRSGLKEHEGNDAPTYYMQQSQQLVQDRTRCATTKTPPSPPQSTANAAAGGQ